MLFSFPTGTTAENDAMTLQLGQLSVDTEAMKLRVHDGVTSGGHVAPKPAEPTEPAV